MPYPTLQYEPISPVPEELPRPLWSVMIPTYNCAKYLRETLLSVLAQDPGAEFMQIEVVDDCSTLDDPQAVVEAVGKGRVSFYRQPQNVGHVKNFNTCLQRSRGRFVHLLHGDDRVRPGFYQTMQQAFEQNPEVGAAFCRNIGMSEDGHWEWISQLAQSESGILANWLEQIATFNRLQPPAMVARREIYEKVGGFDTQISCCAEDWEMWVRLATQCKVWYEVQPLVEYRGRVGSLTSSCRRTGQNVRDLHQIIDRIQAYLPPELAKQLHQKAKENWAIYALQEVAWPMFVSGQWSAALNQIQAVFRLSVSPKVIQTLLQIFLKVGKQNLKRILRQGISLVRKPSRLLEDFIRPLILQTSVKHLYGAKQIDYAADELIVLSVVRNGEYYVKSFIEHHLNLGVKHIVLLDNGSTDNTIAIARQYKNVTVLQTTCPYSKYETQMKKYLVQRFSKNRWNLFVDIDELFDYPFSNVLSLKSLLTYLNQHSYSAVLTQMLDLFSEQPLAQLNSEQNDDFKEKYPYYDITNLDKETYPAYYGFLNNKNVKWHQGGIRKTLFGTNNYLSKAALTFVDDQIELFVNCHQVRQARIADFTAVLRHYPFVSSFYKKVAEAVKTNRYASSASHEYELYWRRLEQDPNLTIKQATACKLETIETLIDQGFLVISEDYQYWVTKQQAQPVKVEALV